jgi:hypothetical protein
MGEKVGKCYDDDCGGYLWPPEARRAFELFATQGAAITPEEENLIKTYEGRFPRTTVGGGAAIPSLNSFFYKITNAQCSLPPKGGRRRTYKKKRMLRKTKRILRKK